MTETNRLPESWVNILNRTGLIWVPSRFSEQVFRENGVKRPMIVTPYGVDVKAHRRQDREVFRVLAWGDSLYSRKRILTAIAAFIAADLPRAEMEVKLNVGPVSLPSLNWRDEHGQEYPNITIHHGDWTRSALETWIHKGHVGIYLSGGEGYGLMPKEMMASGMAMITVDHSGMSEYLSSPDAPILRVSSRLAPSAYFNRRFHVDDAMEYAPSFDDAVDHLRWAYHHREALFDMGMQGAAYVSPYTWEAAGKLAFDRLVEYTSGVVKA